MSKLKCKKKLNNSKSSLVAGEFKESPFKCVWKEDGGSKSSNSAAKSAAALLKKSQVVKLRKKSDVVSEKSKSGHALRNTKDPGKSKSPNTSTNIDG